jgi:predicted nucleotidyltransferase
MGAPGSRPSRGSDAAGDLEAVRRIVLSGLRAHPARVFLFGSRARGDHRVASDIDVAVLPLGPIPAGLLARIREELDESQVPFVVDLVDLREAPPSLRERALREGTEWTASTGG